VPHGQALALDDSVESVGDLLAVGEIGGHRLQVVDVDVNGRVVIGILVMNLTVRDLHLVDAQRKQLVGRRHPRAIDGLLALRPGRSFDEVQVGVLKMHLAHECSVHKRVPLHRKINALRRHERSLHLAVVLEQLQILDDVCALEQVDIDVVDMSVVPVDFGEAVVDIVLEPWRHGDARRHQRHQQGPDDP
jgi:hypothetical protein